MAKCKLGKIPSGKSDEIEISSFFPFEKFSPTKLSPIRYFKVAQTMKYQSIFKQNLLYSRPFKELFSRKGEKSKYQGDKFSFLCEETLTLTEIESRKN